MCLNMWRNFSVLGFWSTVSSEALTGHPSTLHVWTFKIRSYFRELRSTFYWLIMVRLTFSPFKRVYKISEYESETKLPFWQRFFCQPRSIYKISYISYSVVGKFSLLECMAALSTWKVKPIQLSIAWLVGCQTVSVVLRLHKRKCHSWVTTRFGRDLS